MEEIDGTIPNIIGSVDFSRLKQLDTVYINYGYNYVRAIVKQVLPTGIIFTTPKWLKEENTYQSFDAIRSQSKYLNLLPFMGKPYSKLRWWLKM